MSKPVGEQEEASTRKQEAARGPSRLETASRSNLTIGQTSKSWDGSRLPLPQTDSWLGFGGGVGVGGMGGRMGCWGYRSISSCHCFLPHSSVCPNIRDYLSPVILHHLLPGFSERCLGGDGDNEDAGDQGNKQSSPRQREVLTVSPTCCLLTCPDSKGKSYCSPPVLEKLVRIQDFEDSWQIKCANNKNTKGANTDLHPSFLSKNSWPLTVQVTAGCRAWHIQAGSGLQTSPMFCLFFLHEFGRI